MYPFVDLPLLFSNVNIIGSYVRVQRIKCQLCGPGADTKRRKNGVFLFESILSDKAKIVRCIDGVC